VPDLSILGKALGAGLPIGAISGTQAAMACLASGRLMHRGTFNGNPLSVAAAIACLKVLMADHVATYLRMTRVTADLCATINAQAARVNVAIHAQQSGAALQIFAGVREMDGMAGLGRVDRDKTVDFTAEMLRAGVFTLPRGLMYLSAIHTEQDIAETKIAIATAMTRYAARLAATAP
jgi:glutamate-1-semialdehyde 2,1-aminomutase